MSRTQPKFLIVTGGTVSGLGKGTAISSLGVVLKSHGIRVTCMKIDPYLNVDAGTMSPFEHGEVFVLDDGAEADLDLGNYERFLDLNLSSVHSLTSGKIYERVLRRERAGDYLGKTVQMVPHVTEAIQDWLLDVAAMPTDRSGQAPEICLVELGGTVGDIESAVYLEALQQLAFKVGRENFLCVHVGFVPILGATGEQKTKPCQHSVKVMREAGLKPDLLFCRSEKPVNEEIRRKLSLFCQVQPQEVISVHNESSMYKIPLLLSEQNVGNIVCERLGLVSKSDQKAAVLTSGIRLNSGADIFSADPLQTRLGDWKGLAERVHNLKKSLKIGIIGKYTGLSDAYMSVIKGLDHATIEIGEKLNIVWIESTDLEPNMKTQDPSKYAEAWKKLKDVAGVLVPGGFGNRGIEGMILAAQYCRENKKPYFGICVGMQIAVIEACRHLLGHETANSTEFDESTAHPVVVFMPEVSATVMGGTMRLGSRCTIIRDTKSLAAKVYGGQPVIYERHRHRYEVNASYVPGLESKGFIFSGQDERGQRMEIIEIPEHPFFLAVQFHPEFKSRSSLCAPTFLAFVLAAAGRLEERLDQDGGVLKVGAGYEQPPQESPSPLVAGKINESQHSVMGASPICGA